MTNVLDKARKKGRAGTIGVQQALLEDAQAVTVQTQQVAVLEGCSHETESRMSTSCNMWVQEGKQGRNRDEARNLQAHRRP